MTATAGGASLFFDSGCGPCTFWARATRGVARSRLTIHSLEGAEADRALRQLAPEQRFGYAHLVEGGRTRTGAELMPVWVGLIAGSSARTLAERAPPIRWALRAAYERLWRHRQRSGCGSTARRSA